MKIIILFSFLALALMAGCAHHRDVRPSVDGSHKVVLKTEDKDKGYQTAMANGALGQGYTYEMKFRCQ